jgi:hypothetical protein
MTTYTSKYAYSRAVVDKALQMWPEERNFEEWKKILPWTRTLGKGTLYKVIGETKALQNAFPTPQDFFSSPQSLPADPVQVSCTEHCILILRTKVGGADVY